MLRTIATGLLTRKLARGVYRMSPNPIVRAAGTAAMGMAIARMMRETSAYYLLGVEEAAGDRDAVDEESLDHGDAVVHHLADDRDVLRREGEEGTLLGED